MNSLTAERQSRAKLLGRARTKLLVAVGASAVLVLGVTTAPRTDEALALVTSEERTAPLLEAELARRETLATFERVQETGNRVLGYSVAFAKPDPPPARARHEYPAAFDPRTGVGLGVAVAADGQVLTHVNALMARMPLTFHLIDGMAIDAEIAAYEPATGLVLLRSTSPVGLAAAPLARQHAAAGAMTTAAARTGDGDFIAPVVVAGVSARAYTLSGGESLPPGTPLYDQEGALLAITARGNLAFPAADAVERLNGLAAAGRGEPSAVGIVLQARDAPLVPWFGDDGVVVSEIEAGGPAHAAGLQPGDVLIAIDGASVIDAADAFGRLGAAPAGRELLLRLRRDGRTLDVALTPVAAIAWAIAPRPTTPASAAVHARDLLPPEHLDIVPPDARVLSVNLRPVTSVTAAARTIARARSGSLLHVDDGGERYFVAVPGAPR